MAALVERRLNNNVVLAVQNGQTFVAMGCGLGFGVHPGDTLDESRIEQRFLPSHSLTIGQMADILFQCPPELVEATQQLVALAGEQLHTRLNPNVLFTLLDHISFAARRDISLPVSPIDWEVRRFYPAEVRLGEQALKLLHEKAGVVLPQSEVAFLALHFVNAQFERESSALAVELTETINNIRRIVQYHYKRDLREGSVQHNRFVTHVRYYLMRQINGEPLPPGNPELYQLLVERMPFDCECVEKIAGYLKTAHGWDVPDTERMYLLIHLGTLTGKPTQPK